MARVVFLIDGFNLYHALKHNASLNQYKWLDLNKLAKCFLKSGDSLVNVAYFTAYATHQPESMARHQKYVRVLTHFGVKTVFGEFKLRDRYCTGC